MPKIIAFCGFAGTGKDTAAKFFIAKGYKRLTFGDVLKDVVSVMFGIDRAILEGDTPISRFEREQVNPFWDQKLNEVMDLDITPRELLKLVGEHMRQLHISIWAYAMERRLLAHIQAGDNVVISDLRHISEWRLLQVYDAKCIGIYQKQPSWVRKFYTHMGHWFPGGAEELLTLPQSSDSATLEYASRCEALRVDGKRIHTSEWQHLLLPLDTVISNKGSIRALHKKLEDLL